jgi:hypothetical protein
MSSSLAGAAHDDANRSLSIDSYTRLHPGANAPAAIPASTSPPTPLQLRPDARISPSAA